MILTLEEVLKVTRGSLIQGGSRVLRSGEFLRIRERLPKGPFIALKGLASMVISMLWRPSKKSRRVLIEEDKVGDLRWNGDRSKAVIAVKDTLSALGDIARDWRRKQAYSGRCLTGSNGKTTT